MTPFVVVYKIVVAALRQLAYFAVSYPGFHIPRSGYKSRYSSPSILSGYPNKSLVGRLNSWVEREGYIERKVSGSWSHWFSCTSLDDEDEG